MMSIPFPSQYKKTIQNGTKKWTLRIGNEIGKYKKGRKYKATNYSGQDWGIKLKVLDVISTKISKLSKHGVPIKSITPLLKGESVKESTIVDLVKFEYV